MQLANCLATGGLEQERQWVMHEAGAAAPNISAADAGCKAKMLAIGLAHRGGVADEGPEQTGGEGRAVIITTS